MGRKIPGRKHRGVKDPEKQQLVRLQSVKGKINAPPTDPDSQEIPKSLSRIAQLKETLKNKRKVKYEETTDSNKYQKGKHKKTKQFEQFRGESDKHFLFRVQQACDAVIREKAFENKYGVEVKRNPNTGEVEKLVKRPKDELDQLMKNARKKGKNKKQKKAVNSEVPVLTKSQKRQKKLNEKKQQKMLNQLDSEFQEDNVRFGEVVHAPPNLTVSQKIAKAGVPRPGQRDLLLKSVIKDGNTSEGNNSKKSDEQGLKKTANKVIDKSGKRKNLPVALRRRLEKQQAEVIDAYRALKKQNQTSI
ncbi:hypothetical protein ILUMI_08485 [Ignelater luminosus]|uniref:Coiled-coil domain-containing protein 137 n=1 Tax=Ignelater luminosus TaxID=2038154 RepID=A0A8K0GFW8_IGNLU|nr:hypothetical protein ILUMI_08485 [Ignelater luminosus]